MWHVTDSSGHTYFNTNGRLPLFSARPAVTFPAAEHYRNLSSTVLYCLVSEGGVCANNLLKAVTYAQLIFDC